jgi:hypothetical protein
MTEKPVERSARNFWRFALLLLLVTPFLPEIMIGITVGLAEIRGCRPELKCQYHIAGRSVYDIITFWLETGAGSIVKKVRSSDLWLVLAYLAVTGWLVVCYVALTKAWTHKASRLLLGLAVFLLASLPYFGPQIALKVLEKNICLVNIGGVTEHPCMLFGDEVKSGLVSDVVSLGNGWLGIVLALVIFIIYAIVVSIVSRRRVVTSRQ